MKRAAILVSALAVVLYTVGISAQAKPSFAGKWTMDAPAAPPAAPAGGGGGGGRGGGGRGGGGPVSTMAVTITQDDTTLTIDKVQAGRGGAEGTPIKLTYKLDGTDSKNSVAGRGGVAMEQTSKAVWEGDKLTITTTATFGDAPVTTKQSISLDGGKLKVENFGADGAATTTLTYTKGA